VTARLQELALGNSLVLPALDLCLHLCDALLFSLEDFDGDSVAVVELNELLQLGCQFAKPPAVTLGFLLGVLCLGTDELSERLP
jgi:hypothetical protein